MRIPSYRVTDLGPLSIYKAKCQGDRRVETIWNLPSISVSDNKVYPRISQAAISLLFPKLHEFFFWTILPLSVQGKEFWVI